MPGGIGKDCCSLAHGFMLKGMQSNRKVFCEVFEIGISVCIIRTGMMNSREIIRRLIEDGWILARTKGDHHQYKHPKKVGLVTVPHPRKVMPIGTMRSIFRQAGWKWE
jgi:predicted RNA binding protein YcfA (HicA-like mRNA interferase family)